LVPRAQVRTTKGRRQDLGYPMRKAWEVGGGAAV
jgi:hypothetical protein